MVWWRESTSARRLKLLVTIAKNVLLLVVFPLLEGIHCPINIKLRIIGFGTELTNIICLEINLLERIFQLLLPINPFSNMLPPSPLSRAV